MSPIFHHFLALKKVIIHFDTLPEILNCLTFKNTTVLTNISSGKQEAPEARIISSTDEVMSIQRKLNKGYYVLSVILPNGDFISEKFEKK